MSISQGYGWCAASFIGFFPLLLLLHADSATVSALFTGHERATFWDYCLAFRLCAVPLE